ncbi:MAG: hypothetical protein JO015_06475 [Verrucomicrobia bacterium]|nr:hypothetical protein [Verrucomicrobiota bacterium]
MSAALSASNPLAAFALPDLPRRSPRTSIILAELARQRRQERCRRRQVRARRAAWLFWLDRRPFDSARVPQQPLPGLVFAGGMLQVCVTPRARRFGGHND